MDPITFETKQKCIPKFTSQKVNNVKLVRKINLWEDDNSLNVSEMLKLFEYQDMHFDNHFEKVSPFFGLIKAITVKLQHL